MCFHVFYHQIIAISVLSQGVSGVFVLVKENERNILPYITVKEGQISQSFLDQVQTMNWNNGDVVFSEQGPNDSFKQGLKTAAHELKVCMS